MKSGIALAATFVLFFAAPARAGDAAIDAAVRAFGVAFNTGDVKAAKALFIAAPAITDEVAPHYWSGPGAFDGWLADLGKSETAEGKTGGQMAISPPTREVISGSSAYVIVPATYTFEQKNVTLREVAQMTFVLTKHASHWKIASWTWTGAEGVPVGSK